MLILISQKNLSCHPTFNSEVSHGSSFDNPQNMGLLSKESVRTTPRHRWCENGGVDSTLRRQDERTFFWAAGGVESNVVSWADSCMVSACICRCRYHHDNAAIVT